MASKSLLNNRTNVNGNECRPATSAAEAKSSAINYEEVQKVEIEVLRSIFQEDFLGLKEEGSAWSTAPTSRTLQLRIRPFSEPDESIVLTAKLGSTYPRSVPSLSVQGLESYHARTQAKISTLIQQRPKDLVENEMIHTISEEIREALEEAIAARQSGALPSLDGERAWLAKAARTAAKQAEEAEARRQQEAQKEEEEKQLRDLTDMTNQQISLQAKRKSLKPANEPPIRLQMDTTSEVVYFGASAEVEVGNDVETFTQVSITGLLSRTGAESTYLGRPLVTQAGNVPIVAVKRRRLEKKKAEIIDLENVMSAVQKLKHPNLLNVLAYCVNPIDASISELVICREYADRGPLYDLLTMSDLQHNKCRQFTTELLQGLDFLHGQGMIHGFVSVKTTYLTSTPNLSPKLSGFGYANVLGLQDSSIPSAWRCPASPLVNRKSDVWDLGILVAQMFLGLEIMQEYNLPTGLIARSDLSDAFRDFLRKVFDCKKSISCFELLPAELLRKDEPVLQQVPNHAPRQSRKSSSGMPTPLQTPYLSARDPASRYLSDFTELGRLGKGGFGEVVKARNKLDHGVYAIKKIKQSQNLLDKVLREVMVLSRLNHAYVVRYFTAWIEYGSSNRIGEDAVSTTDEATTDETTTDETTTDEATNDVDDIEFGIGEMDFVSGNQPSIEFSDDETDDLNSQDDPFGRDGVDHDEANGTSTVSEETSPAKELDSKRPRSDSHRLPSTLYIQMELCDRRSLRDLIEPNQNPNRNRMSEEDAWRYLRQITEGLAHIHSNGIIHRDLKPDNVFIDRLGNPKIGDLGLAKSGQYAGIDRQIGGSKGSVGDMTKSVGTFLYVAPELRSTSNASCTDKVDMYSLGIMFFEMCQHFETSMERMSEIERIRLKDHKLPPAFWSGGQKSLQGELIRCLISHKPSERPSSADLLRDDRLPVKIEDETIRVALKGLSDVNSPYHQQLMEELFSQGNINAQRAKGFAWDAQAVTTREDPARTRLRSVARASFEAVFRRHGAEEVRRDFIFPISHYYGPNKVVQLLDSSGNLLQLPFDLVLPYARQLARQPASTRCTFTFSGAYRKQNTGGPPKATIEADFDVVNEEGDTDTALNDAEAMKVMDEALSDLLSSEQIYQATYFHITHGLLIDAIMEYCRVPPQHVDFVKERLARLNFLDDGWAKARPELRIKGLSDTTLEDLATFNWKDEPETAFDRLTTLFSAASQRTREKAEKAMNALRHIFDLANRFSLSNKVYVSPTSCVNAKFYASGVIFQFVGQQRVGRSLLAAGGRYDKLIQEHRKSDGTGPKQGAVGMSFALDTIVSNFKALRPPKEKEFLKNSRVNKHLDRRCDVLVIANGTENLRHAGIELMRSLWTGNISAEMSRDHGSWDPQEYLYTVNLRHETSPSVRCTNTDNDVEEGVLIRYLVSHIQQGLRDRAGTKSRRPPLLHQNSTQEDTDRKANVHVLLARHGSKKSNKYEVITSAQQKWEEKLDASKEAEILAVETRDAILDLIQETRLGDPESWRKATQNVPTNERQYFGEIREMLDSWREKFERGEGMREACVYNFRTQRCIYYDLGA